MISTNLIPADRLAVKRRRARMRFWIPACLGYVLVLAAALCLCRAVWGADGDVLIDEIEATEKQIADSNRSIAGLRDELAEARIALEAGRAMGDQPDWSILLALLARQLGDDVVLCECKLSLVDVDESADGNASASSGRSAKDTPPSQRRYRLNLSGFGRTQTAVSRFVLLLERIEPLKEVRLRGSTRQPFLSARAVAFRIDCSI